MITAKVHFKGKVQGVFFRRSVCDQVQGFSVTGYVQNLPDGSVEAYFQGDKEEIEDLITQIRKNPGKAVIDKIITIYQNNPEKFHDFSIKY